MKGTALLLLCAITAQATQPQLTARVSACHDAEEAANACSVKETSSELLVHRNCNQFYKCSNGRAIPYFCPGILLYNPLLELCDWPENVQCGTRIVVSPEDDGVNNDNCDSEEQSRPTTESTGVQEDGNDSGTDGTCKCNPEEAPALCAAGDSDGVLVIHKNCNQFSKCDNGVPITISCPDGLLYNPYAEQCDWPQNVDCGERPIVDIEDGDDNEDNVDCEDDDGNGGGESGSESEGGDDGDNGGSCNCEPGEAPGICAVDGSDGTLIAHENCNQFYKCSYGVPVALNCPAGLLYNPYLEQCDWPANVDCGDKPIVEIDSGSNEGNNSEDKSDDNGSGGGSTGGNSNEGTCNCEPGEAPGICAVDGSDGTLIAHENCNQFYKCSYGVPVALNCPAGLLYNPYLEQCDWPANVDCGDKPIVEIDSGSDESNNSEDESDNNGSGGGSTGGNSNEGTCNCEPGEAPGICAVDGSDGTLIAHENCNQFYKCSNGVPVTLNCPAGLLYNPYIEQCDWPANVDCGDKPIVEIDSGSDESNNSEDESDNNGSGGGSTGGNSNESTCKCEPGEAPGICAVDGSDGTLIAHENCNQFYKCSNGVPVTLNCPAGLLYNPYLEQCDWPANVDCGDKPIVEIDSGSNESNNSEDESDDNGSGGGSTGGNSNEGTCNCEPGEAPGICAVDGSDGTLIAHENCNQFYKCSNGVPVTLNCPAGLVYNPYLEQCDWPANVDCGDKPIIEIDCGSNESNNSEDESDDNGSGGGSTGGNSNESTCNCEPGEAPGICAVDGSDGTLIAHENCNQFYKCSNGVPVTLNCPAGLLYNPYLEQCDWPANVDCGDKPIVEIDSGSDESNNSEDESDNNGSGGGSTGGNSNESTCKCEPGEAPGICAVDGSDGTLIAHENCNQFYKCSNGVPVTLNCPAGLLYNPYLEQCDWPANVDCGDKPIVEIDSGSNESNNSEDESDDNGSGGGSTGGNSNESTCNCEPGEAPGICAVDGSDGTLIAHENCNQFYKCSNGVPVTLNCPAGLVYNPYLEQCDWPANVDCGDKPIVEIDSGSNESNNSEDESDDNGSGGGSTGGNSNEGTCNCEPGEAPGICAVDGSDGTLIAHENCNQFYKCSNGVPVTLNCPAGLVYNPYLEQCDWPANVDCGDKPIIEIDCGSNESNNSEDKSDDNGSGGGSTGGNSNESTCNCEPGEAPGICAVDGSDGTLIAHENCNQFYKCSNGVPVTLNCPAGLLYNPYLEQCDWPANVDCGDKPIVEIDSGSDESNNSEDESDNNGSGGGSTGGNSNESTCKCEPGEAPGICAVDGSDGTLIAHENCNQFYQCSNGVPVTQNCPAGLVYNPYIEQCDWPANVDCGDKPIVEIDCDSNEDNNSEDESDDNGSGGGSTGGNSNEGTCNCEPGEAPGICVVDGSDGTLIAHENCNQFYQCSNGVPVTQNCPAGLVYNPYIEQCDWPANVDCGDKPIVEIDCDSNEDNNSEDESDDNGSGGGSTGGNSNEGTCNCEPGEAPGICAVDGSDGTLIAHENCNQFYKCSDGVPVALNCPAGLLYNPYLEQCDWPANVDCGDKPIVEIDSGSNESNNSEDESDDNGSGGGSTGGNSNEGTCNCEPGEAPGICAVDGSDGTLVAHENCNQFYKCSNGVPVTLNCPAGLLYNPYLEQCDWPANVDCGDKPIVEIDSGSDESNNSEDESDNNGSGGGSTGGNSNEGTCNCEPGEAPGICAVDGSDGTLIAHENCNQFYKCSDGVPVALNCPAGLLYNPYLEQCDWPANVDCGDKPIVEIDSGSNESNNSEDESDDNGSGGGSTGGNSNEGTCNCEPGEAPGICAVDGSDGTLVAHENCNQFYKCSNGVPVTLNCPAGLLYNPYLEQCDWPANVDCGDKPIVEIDSGSDESNNSEDESDNNGSGGGSTGGNSNEGTCNCEPGEAPGICAVDGSDGTLIAHENCNQFYKCSDGVPVALNCPAGLLYNPYLEQCDWPANVDCGDKPIIEIDCGSNESNNSEDESDDNGSGGGSTGGNSNEGTCNCEPGEAPGICAVDGSDGTLIAHENCNQFYKCSYGVPVTLNCPAGLLYNPYLEQCDWPANVDCGDKPIVEIDSGSDESNNSEDESDNNGSGGGSTGGNSNEGTCNCEPGEAPGICAVEGSDGTLIAHENCNQFYKCANGEPVALHCNEDLLYNPQTEQCDWPANVDCGDRPIVEVDNGSESGDGSSGGNDSGDGDNEGGTCNCNPDEAPGICGESGSDGVLVAHENCNQFYKCAHGEPVALYCNDGLLYNPQTEQCDWPANVDCGDRPIVEVDGSESGDGGSGGNDNGDSSNGDNDSGDGDNENESSDNSGGCDCNEEITGICALGGSPDQLFIHENCNQYYQCVHGVPTCRFCPPGTLFHPVNLRCELSSNVDCGDRSIVEIEGGEDNDSDSGGDNNDSGDNPVTCNNCNPDEAETICIIPGSDSSLVAHENCNQFYQCAHGLPVAIFCAGDLLFNPYTQRCDWPANVDCGGKPIVEVETGDDDSSTSGETDGGNEIDVPCDPSQAPTICAAAGSDNILLCHENCDKFYVCNNGVPLVLDCPSNLVYNPEVKDCDWPQSVVCGERDISEGSGEDGPCACDARQAPSICAGSGSNGKMIAHENCDQYYVCFEGVPVARSCPQMLFYDPHTEQCLWPASVNCEGRAVNKYSSLNKHTQARRGLF